MDLVGQPYCINQIVYHTFEITDEYFPNGIQIYPLFKQSLTENESRGFLLTISMNRIRMNRLVQIRSSFPDSNVRIMFARYKSRMMNRVRSLALAKTVAGQSRKAKDGKSIVLAYTISVHYSMTEWLFLIDTGSCPRDMVTWNAINVSSVIWRIFSVAKT